MTSAPLMIISVDRELSISEQQRIAVRWRGPYDWSRDESPEALLEVLDATRYPSVTDEEDR